MTTVIIPDFLPQLYVGKHDKDSGRACIMNAFAYMKGDVTITDLPDCVWPPFAKMAQFVNDRLCVHLTEELTSDPVYKQVRGNDGVWVRVRIGSKTVHRLCGNCAHEVWMMGAPLIGTAELASKLTWPEQRKFLLHVGLRLMHQRYVNNGTGYPRAFYTIIAKVQAIAYGDGMGRLVLDEQETDYTRDCSSVFSNLIQMGMLHMDTNVLDCFADLVFEWGTSQGLTNDLGFHTGAYSMSRQLDTFVDWLHQAAGQSAPARYTVAEDEVAKVPVMAA